MPKHNIKKTDVFYRCDDETSLRLMSRKDTTIYVTNRAYWNMSERFMRMVKLRNILVIVVAD